MKAFTWEQVARNEGGPDPLTGAREAHLGIAGIAPPTVVGAQGKSKP